MLCACKQSTHPKQKAKKCLEKKVLKKVICIIHTINYCNLLRRNHDLRIFQKKK